MLALGFRNLKQFDATPIAVPYNVTVPAVRLFEYAALVDHVGCTWLCKWLTSITMVKVVGTSASHDTRSVPVEIMEILTGTWGRPPIG